MEKLDLVIIGAGPTGITAAIYAKRAGLKFEIYEKMAIGGLVLESSEIENYPGFGYVNGYEIAEKLAKHLEYLDVKVKYENIVKIEKIEEKNFKVTFANDKVVFASNVLLATGASNKKLNVPGEAEFKGRGVSYCATCEANFYKNKKVAVIGAGDTGLMSAIVLSRLCEKVTIIHRSDKIRGNYRFQKKLENLDNVEFILNAHTQEIKGTDKVESVVFEHEGEIKSLDVSGVFVAVGLKPNSELVKDLCEVDEMQAVVSDSNMETTCSGLYAAGDVRNTHIRQIVTGMADSVYAIEKISSEQ